MTLVPAVEHLGRILGCKLCSVPLAFLVFLHLLSLPLQLSTGLNLLWCGGDGQDLFSSDRAVVTQAGVRGTGGIEDSLMAGGVKMMEHFIGRQSGRGMADCRGDLLMADGGWVILNGSNVFLCDATQVAGLLQEVHTVVCLEGDAGVHVDPGVHFLDGGWAASTGVEMGADGRHDR